MLISLIFRVCIKSIILGNIHFVSAEIFLKYIKNNLHNGNIQMTMNEKYEEYFTDTNTDIKKTYKELAEEHPTMNLFFIICIAALIFAGINEVTFRLQYIFPPSYTYSNQPINIYQEPIQTEPSSKSFFNYTAKNGQIYGIIPMANYNISAIVAAKNTNLWLRGLMNSNFDNIALIDLGLLCGEVANNETLKHIKLRSKKTLNSARELRTIPRFGFSWDDFNKYLASKNLSIDYYMGHMSHVHIIPANDNVMSALIRLRKNDIIKLDGYLIDLEYPNGSTSKTSLSRTDTNLTSRGNGACEVMYVQSLQLGNKLYQ